MNKLQKIEKNPLAVQREESAETKYTKLIELILDKVRVATNQSAFTQELQNAMVLEWKDHLSRHKVKGEDLLSLYNDAIAYRAKTDRRNAFCVEDMLGAWFRIQEKRANIPNIGKSAKDCSKCDKDGYIYLQRPDKVVQLVCNHE